MEHVNGLIVEIGILIGFLDDISYYAGAWLYELRSFYCLRW